MKMKLIYKHSYRCPLSSYTITEVNKFLKSEKYKVEYLPVDVINDRHLAIDIAEKYGIPHQSPQVIIVDENDEAVWHESHHGISAADIESFFASLES